MWEHEIIEFKNYLKLERSLSDNSGDNLVAASCNYANSANVTSWSNLVYENGSYNEITILETKSKIQYFDALLGRTLWG